MSDRSDSPAPGANPDYALGQLAAALATAREHPDAETRARADRRASDWLRVFGNMLSGALRIGSRTPVDGVPAWATSRVLGGGFASGDLRAGGPLQPHEVAWLEALPEGVRGGRRALFDHFLGEAGLGRLVGMLESGRYRVEVPEEGALLAVAWLVTRGHADAARAVVAEIAPWADRLRFHPIPTDAPPSDPERVRLRDVADELRALRRTEAPADLRDQHEALTVWRPYEDRLVALAMETVDGPLPSLVEARDDGTSVVEGGWPFQTFPDGWAGRAREALAEYPGLRAAHSRCRRPERRSTTLYRLRQALAVAAHDPAALTGRDVGVVRTSIAHIRATRGLPGSERLADLRAEQARVAALPTKADWAAVLARRLDEHGAEGGLLPADIDALLAPVGPDEAARAGVPAGEPFPERFRAGLLRATEATPEQHIAWGTLTSGEALARVVPRIAGHARAAGIRDPALRWLDEALYSAFRRRRSVLLLNLESQVRLDELPWARALEPFREGGASAQEAARAALTRVVSLALTAFPAQILPNKLLQEIGALAAAAGLDLPVVNEVAADIFMGTFTEKYLRAAQRAGRSLRGSLYARYYQIDVDALVAIDDVERPERGAATSPAFARLCYARAGVEPRADRWWGPVSENGAVIEQEQVLTTHNLAPLVDALGLADALGPRWAELASRTFSEVAAALERLGTDRRGQLRALKNAAYAWRQMVYYLSMLPPAQAAAVLDAAAHRLADEGSGDLQERLGGVLADLREVAQSEEADARRPFYGWAVSRHPLETLQPGA